MESSPAPGARRRPRRPRRPQRQQIMLRRGLALGGGLILVILIVLGVKGCLDARAHRALSDYARNVTQVVQESEQTSKSFFGKLEDPGTLSVTDFENVVNAEASAVANQASRVDGFSAPGDMGGAQRELELVYELRSSAMSEIAKKMGTALGEAGSAKATAGIANQMEKLLASDVVYRTVARPGIDAVLADNGIEGSDVPESEFLPGPEWLEESTVGSALGAVSGSSGEASPGIHGLGLVGASLNGTELVEGGTATVSGEETAEVEVQVQNQGESTENGVAVSVSVNGGHTLQQNISAISPGEISSVTIPLTPTPSGQVTLDVEVETVAGEQVSTNNKASYTVSFE